MLSRYVALFIGVWYLLAPSPIVWGYPPGFLWWHEVVIGALVTALATTFFIQWSRLAAWALMAVGLYSMLAPFPFAHGYLQDVFAFWNDLVFGILTIGVGTALAAASIEYDPTVDELAAG